MRRDLLTLALMLTCMAGMAGAGPRFEAVATGPSPRHEYSGGWEHFVGGGMAAFDCDGDLLPELYAAGGTAPATLFRNRTPAPGAALAFAPRTPEALALTGVTGAYPLDIDSDGMLDLAVLRVGANLLLKGGPDCSFAPFAPELGFTSDDAWTTSFSATWEAGRALPTLAFGNYVDRDDPAGPFETCDDNLLYRPEGQSYDAPTPLAPGFCALSMLFSDWGRQGRADLRISNDRHYYVKGGEEQMWAMEPTPRLYGPADGWQSFQLWGMGIASRDISGDGRPEVYLSSMGDQRLQSLVDGANGAPTYGDAVFARGTTAHRPYTGGDGRPSTGWHIAFGDVGNDGRDDIFISKGNVEQMPGSAMKDPNNLLIQMADGRFEEAGAEAGIASMARSRGAVLMDLNLDGLLDLAVVNRRAPVEIYQNVTDNAGNWLAVVLHQPAPNVNAVGAWIEVAADGRVQAREVTVGGGHAGGVAGPEHFGLGAADRVRLRVIWPGGEVGAWQEVAAGGLIGIDRAGGAFSPD